MNHTQTNISPASLPAELAGLVTGYRWSRIDIGCSAADVYHLHSENAPGRYLKMVSLVSGHSLERERLRLEWLRDRVPVPQILGFASDDGAEYLLTTEVPGIPAYRSESHKDIEQLTRLLAGGLRMMHMLPVDGCPFDHRTDMEIAEAGRRMEAGLVDESDFEDAWSGWSAKQLFNELMGRIPLGEDLVVTHGDYCLPNVIVDGGAISGFIDVGRAGIGDRYRDLALAAQSLQHNYGKGLTPLLFKEYGIENVDQKKLEFFMLLDEFF